MRTTLTTRLFAACCALQAFLPGVSLQAQAVPEPPRATSAPSVIPLLLLPGQTQQFGAAFSGDGPFQYQWTRDGVVLPNGNAETYTIAGATAADTGRYRLRVTNSAGSAEFLVVEVMVTGTTFAEDNTARAFRLMDYYYPRVEGAEWLYTGTDARTGQVVDSRIRMADLDRSITCFTGRGVPTGYAATTMAVDGAHGRLNGAVFTPARTWTDYISVAPDALAMWGDDYPSIESARVDGALRFPGQLTIGQKAEQRVDTYDNGVYIGSTWILLRLLGVESVDTPAGRFDNCLRLRIELEVPGSSTTQIYDEWWAAGIGKVRRQWVEGPGDTVNSLLLSCTLPATTRYRLADYFVMPIAGSVFTSTGKSWGGSESNTVSTITGTAVTIKSYTGTGFPGTPGTPVNQQVMADSNVSRLIDGTVHEAWSEYMTLSGSQITYWGLDNAAGGGEIRFGAGVPFPVDMAVGESTTISRNAYANGLYAGPGSMKVELLGVEHCTVPAGTFANSLHMRFTVSFATQSQSYEMWMAPTVGCVRYKAVAGGGQRERNLVSWAVPRAPVVDGVGGTSGGNDVFFKVLASGTGPMAYQWYQGETGDTSRPITGATTAGFQVPALTACTCYWARVTNALGHADTANVLVEPTPMTVDFKFWELVQRLPASCRGPNSTPAGDGVPNLLKYALWLGAMDSVAEGRPAPVVVGGLPGERHLGLEFTRNPLASDLRLELEVSSDLKTWTVVPSALELTKPEWGDEYVRLREIAPLGAATRRFERLKVSLAP